MNKLFRLPLSFIAISLTTASYAQTQLDEVVVTVPLSSSMPECHRA